MCEPSQGAGAAEYEYGVPHRRRCLQCRSKALQAQPLHAWVAAARTQVAGWARPQP